MNKTAHPRLNRLILMAMATGLIAACHELPQRHIQGEPMNPSHAMTLWQVVDRLVDQIPLTKEKVETVLSATLKLQESRAGKNYYESEPISLADSVVIEDVDLRVSRSGETPGFLVLGLGGACVSLSQVREHYRQADFSAPTYTQSPEEKKYYSADVSRGKLHFGFKQGYPDCLASIVFDSRESR